MSDIWDPNNYIKSVVDKYKKMKKSEKLDFKHMIMTYSDETLKENQ